MIRRACLAMTLAVLSMGVSAKQAPLPMPLAPALPVEVVMNQHELAVDVPNTAGAVGAQFGLIGALIGAGIQNAQVKHAEERVVPLRNVLLDYHFNQRLETALRAKLASDGLSPAPVIKVMQTPWEAVDARQHIQDVPLHAMVIVPRYSVDSDVTTLSVTLTASIVDRVVKSNGKVKSRAEFSRNYAFHFPLVGEGDDNAKRWADMGTERLSALLDQGIAQATDMLVYDFSSEGRNAQWDKAFKRESVAVKGMSYPGHAVRQSADWAWVRNPVMIQGYQPVIDVAPAAMTAAIAPTPAASANVATPAAQAVSTPIATPTTAPAAASEAVGAPTTGAPAAAAANGAH